MVLAEVQQGYSNRVTESTRATVGLHADDGTPTERMREANGRTAIGSNARDGMVAGDKNAAQSTLEKIGLGSFAIASAAEPKHGQQRQVDSGQSMVSLVDKRVGQAAVGAVFGSMGAGPTAVLTRHWYDKALPALEDVKDGAINEVTHHGWRVAGTFALGFGTAAVVGALGAPVAIGGTILGLGYGAYQIYKRAPDWIHAAEEVAHPEGHAAAELSQAHHVLQNFGGGATDVGQNT